MKQKINETPVDMSLEIPKMHGHTTIILTDKETGEQEVYEDDNMMTNAIADYLQNCGFLNYPNMNQNNMVEEFLGGIIGLDTALPEDADQVYIPAGVEMVFNGSVGVANTSQVTEMGSCSSLPDETGWQADGTYKMTFDFTDQQGNPKAGKSIACVCLTGKDYGYVGEGNSRSERRHSTTRSFTGLGGTVTTYSGVPGQPFAFDLADSSVYSFSVENVEVEGETVKKGFVRQYRLPISKVNIKGTTTAPIKLSETEVALDSDFLTLLNSGTTAFLYQDHSGNLLAWNIPNNTISDGTYWGQGFTQYLWTITPAGVMTKQAVTNTSGANVHCLGVAIFDGNYCFFADTWVVNYSGSARGWVRLIDTRVIYAWNRTNNTMAGIINPCVSAVYDCGANSGQRAWSDDWRTYAGMNLAHGSADGKIVTTSGGGGYPSMVVDAVNGAIYPNNANNTTLGNVIPITQMIGHVGLTLRRSQSYIATINNLETPVVKDSSKTMKVVYSISFEEEEES